MFLRLGRIGLQKSLSQMGSTSILKRTIASNTQFDMSKSSFSPDNTSVSVLDYYNCRLCFIDMKSDNQTLAIVQDLETQEKEFFHLWNNDEKSFIIEAIKREYQPKMIKTKRRHGFLKRLSTKSGRAILRKRIEKGRRRLSKS